MTKNSNSGSSSNSTSTATQNLPNPSMLQEMNEDTFGVMLSNLSNQDRLNLLRANYKLIRGFVDFQGLDFSSTNITNEDLTKIFAELNRLEKELNESNSGGTSLKKQITTINLEDCRSITSNFLGQINPDYIKNLGLKGLNLTKEYYLNIKNNFPGLESIYFDVDTLMHLWQNQEGSELNKIKDLIKYFLPKLTSTQTTNRESINKILTLIDEGSNLEKLKNLDLVYSNITIAVLNKLLKATPNLETLNLFNCESLGGLTGLDLENNSLSKLKNLNLRRLDITRAGLNKLLKATPNLEVLELGGCYLLRDLANLDLENINLEKLKNLNLESLNITPAVLNKLLKAAPNLEILNLSGCRSLGDLAGLDLEKNQLSQLEELDVKVSNITPAGLNKLLKATPNLEILNLSGCRSLGDLAVLDLENIRLTKLKNLNLIGSNITPAGLNKLLKATPNLETLHLSECESLGDLTGLDLENINLTQLKNLDLRYSNITLAYLDELLKAAPNLETLDLHGCRLQEYLTSLDLENNQLSKLKKLDLEDSSITPASLNKLLKATPNLEILNLYKCQSLEDLTGLDLENNQLSKLKKLDLRHSNITKVGLKKFLRLAPDVEIYSYFTSEEISELRSEVKEDSGQEDSGQGDSGQGDLRQEELTERFTSLGEVWTPNIGRLDGAISSTNVLDETMGDLPGGEVCADDIEMSFDEGSNNNPSSKRKADDADGNERGESKKRRGPNSPAPNPTSSSASKSSSSRNDAHR